MLHGPAAKLLRFVLAAGRYYQGTVSHMVITLASIPTYGGPKRNHRLTRSKVITYKWVIHMLGLTDN